jgi:hypothetical protein
MTEAAPAPSSDGMVLRRSVVIPNSRGLHARAAAKLVALIADNYAVEGLPASPRPGSCAALPLHEHCLFKLGVHLGEIWHLTPLAEWLRSQKRSRFLLTAPPLRLPGAIGSPATPIATV